MKKRYNKIKLIYIILVVLFALTNSCLNGNKAERYMDKGIELLEKKDFEESIKYLEYSILILNKDLNKLKEKKLPSEELKEKIRQKEYTLAKSFYYRGKAYKQKGNNEEAIKDFSVSVSLRNDFADAYVERGISFYELGFSKKALENLSIAIDLSPENSTFYYNRGSVYIEEQNYKNAIIDFSQSIKLDFTFTFSYFKRAEAYRLIENYERAVEDYKKAIGLFTNEDYIYDAYLSIGKCYYHLSRYEEAEKSYLNSFEYSETPITANLNLAILYGTLEDTKYGDINKAIQYAKQAIALSNRENEKALIYLASLYYKQDKYEEAYQTQKLALKLKPNDKEINEWFDIYKKKAGH